MLSCLTEFNEEDFRKGIYEEGFAEGREAGLAEGREAGLAEGRDSVIQKLLQKGMSATEITALLDISPAEAKSNIIK